MEDPAASLKPYLPRLALQWISEDDGSLARDVEGTVVFVDISGFTNLSEKLAKVGREGAEALADAIGSTFARLLAVAYGEGGGLIKFGGDALFLLFTGQDHPVRAVRAAAGMRRTLREIGRLETKGGKVTLRMSVGVHTGAFNLFLVGGSHRELMITGPAATQVVTMEGTAVAGEILLSPETAAHLPARCLGEFRGPGILLKRGPTGIASPLREPEIRVDAEAVARCISAATREHLRSGFIEPEHRQVTVAFLHFDHTDALIEREGSSAFARDLDVLVRDVQAAVDEQGLCFLSTDVDHDGGKIILTGGAPRTTGDDEGRMLIAVRRIMNGERTIPIRIGVNRGAVFAGDIGPDYRRTYTIMGDAVNLAARVMAKAEPGQVLVTGAVLDKSRTRFRTSALEPFMVKGKAQPVTAYELGDVTHDEESMWSEDGALPFVGREKEMAVLREALASARAGHGGIVEVVGEPGIGKSRLLEELAREAKGFSVSHTVCGLFESSTPYFAFRQPLREALGVTERTSDDQVVAALAARVEEAAPKLVPWMPLLGVPLDLAIPDTEETRPLEAKFRRARVQEVVGEFFAAVLPRPALMTIEDVHWMDESSADLLRHLSAAISAGPWVVVVTRRDVATGFRGEEVEHVSTLRPGPLDSSAATAMLDAATDDAPLSPHEIAALTRRAGGNPLFLRELLIAARSAGGIEGLPDSIEGLVSAQIDQLDSRDRTLLRYASVLGLTFREDIALRVLGEQIADLDQDPWRGLAAFLSKDREGDIKFGHALIRDTAYGGLPFRRRRAIHALVGNTLEAEADDPTDQAELLSYHFFNSDEPGKAWRYSVEAGERARSSYANIEAAEFYGRALESSKGIDAKAPEVARVHEALGDVCEKTGDYHDAADAYRSARRLLAGDSLEEGRINLKEAEVRERLGLYPQSLRWYRRGLTAIEGVQGDVATRLRAQLCVGYASIRQGQTRYSDAIKWCNEAMRWAESCGARDVMAHAAHTLDWIYTAIGKPAEAPYPGLALEIYEELGDLEGLYREYTNLGIFAYFEGRWDDAVELQGKARDARLKLGDPVHAAVGTLNVAEILSDQGRYEEAEAGFREVLRVWQASGYKEGIAYATAGLGRAASRAARHDEAAALLERAKATFRDMGEERPALETDAWIAENLLFRGESTAALALVADCRARAEKMGGALATVRALLGRLSGYALLQTGDLERAGVELRESLRVGREAEARSEVGLTLEALCRHARIAGSEDEAQAYEDEGRTILRRLGVVRTPDIPLQRVRSRDAATT